MLPTQKLCEICHFPLLETYYFCPNCGKNLKPTPLPTTLIKQIQIYSLSLLLPPLGLWPAIKYLQEKDKEAKLIGFIAILLTVISVVISTWLLTGWVNKINESVNAQLNQYQNIGF